MRTRPRSGNRIQLGAVEREEEQGMAPTGTAQAIRESASGSARTLAFLAASPTLRQQLAVLQRCSAQSGEDLAAAMHQVLVRGGRPAPRRLGRLLVQVLRSDPCDLRGASLRGAHLAGCDLRDADLRGAFLTGADLGRVATGTPPHGLTGARLEGAVLCDLQRSTSSVGSLPTAFGRSGDSGRNATGRCPIAQSCERIPRRGCARGGLPDQAPVVAVVPDADTPALRHEVRVRLAHGRQRTDRVADRLGSRHPLGGGHRLR
ncbi:pentapeptide repeat-containing protein, partial [Streptomyces sp. NPDC048279]|uniref:pentapeptide repeat-containing protein n=1 Tax=Streptomyces sp. NPDC048279 TaxID=3154714 RepID=UPI00341A44D8